MSFSYLFVENVQSYSFCLDVHRKGNVISLGSTIAESKPASGEFSVVKFPVSGFFYSQKDLLPGDSLVVTSCAKGGGSYINSDACVFTSETIQELDSPEPVELKYDLQNRKMLIKWKDVPLSGKYMVNYSINASNITHCCSKNTDLPQCWIDEAELSSHGKARVSVVVMTRARDTLQPFFGSTSQYFEHELAVENLVVRLSIVKFYASQPVVVDWRISDKFRNVSKDIEVLAVVKSDSSDQEIGRTETTGDCGSVSIDVSLASGQMCTVTLFSCLRKDGIVIGVPCVVQSEISK